MKIFDCPPDNFSIILSCAVHIEHVLFVLREQSNIISNDCNKTLVSVHMWCSLSSEEVYCTKCHTSPFPGFENKALHITTYFYNLMNLCNMFKDLSHLIYKVGTCSIHLKIRQNII